MSSTENAADSTEQRRNCAAGLLRDWTVAALSPDAAQWLDTVLAKAADRRSLDIAFGLASRKAGSSLLPLGPVEQQIARDLIDGWHPERWTVSEAVRVLLAIAALDHDPSILDRLARHADTAEQCALYRGLTLYPAHVNVADLLGRGLRTHATPVFESIAHYNPWPAMHFDEHRWNHLVLKAMFMEVALWPMQGFDAKRNQELTRMALDFAAERKAADRPVPMELFRCVAAHASLVDVERYLPATESGEYGLWSDTSTTRALSLSLIKASDRDLAEHVRTCSPHVAMIESGELNWHNYDH